MGAGYFLARAGHRATVLERADRVGGAAGSFDVDGVRVDHGSHRLHAATDPTLLAELGRLLGADLQPRRRNGRIRLLERWIAFPLRPADLVRHLPRGFAARAGRDALLGPLRRARRDTFADVLLAQFGPTLCEHFYFPYARKLWGLDPHEIAGEQARVRVSASSPAAILRRVARGSDPDANVFYYPRRGFGQLWERLAEEAADLGADLRLETTVERIVLRGDGVMVETSGGATVEAGTAWSTLPIGLLARLVDPPPPSDVWEAADRLRFRSMVLVYLTVDVDRISPFDAHYLPAGRTPVTRVSEPKNYRDSPDDPPGRTVLCFEIPCSPGDGAWEATDEELGDVARGCLAEVELGELRPRSVTVRRLPRAYPIYDLGYADAFSTLDRWATAQERLLTFGRQGLFVHDNSHHALAMAAAAASSLRADGRLDPSSWARARERFRSHVVED